MKNKNSIELIDYLGSDKLHGLAAWVSTFAEFDIDIPENIPDRVDVIVNHILNNGKRKRTIQDLLAYLATENHNSPFRFSSFIFTANTDLATHVQKLKHSVILEAENGESARYKELKEDKFYLPEDWNIQTSTFNTSLTIYDGESTWKDILQEYTQFGNELYHKCLEDLTPILGRKRAKESARFFKTYNSQIQADVTFNMRSFANFIKLRNSEHAQLEIREVAQQMQDLVEAIDDKPFKTAMWVITRANELWIKHQEEISKQLIEEFKNGTN